MKSTRNVCPTCKKSFTDNTPGPLGEDSVGTGQDTRADAGRLKKRKPGKGRAVQADEEEEEEEEVDELEDEENGEEEGSARHPETNLTNEPVS
jgi:hypothetical protein